MSSSVRSTTGRVAGAVAHATVRLCAATLLLAVVAAIGLLMVFPRVTGSTALTVLTGSMTPEIPVGSAVFIRPVDTETLQPGDVATYQRKEGVATYITHRVVKVKTRTTPTTFIFKGDANRGRDIDPVPATAIRGEVWFHVPYLGAVRDALNGRAGLTLLAILVLGGYAMSQVWGALRDRRRPRTTPVAAPLEVPCDRLLVLTDLPLAGQNVLAVITDNHGVPLRQTDSTVTALFAPLSPSVERLMLELSVLDPISVTTYAAGDAGLALVSLETPRQDDLTDREEPWAPTSV